MDSAIHLWFRYLGLRAPVVFLFPQVLDTGRRKNTSARENHHPRGKVSLCVLSLLMIFTRASSAIPEVNNGPLVFLYLSNCLRDWERERVTHPLLRLLNDVTLHSGFHTLSSAAAMEFSRTESHWNFWSQECAWHNHSLFGDTMVKASFTSRVWMKIGRNEVRPRSQGSGCCWKRSWFYSPFLKKYGCTRSVLESFSPFYTETLKRWNYDSIHIHQIAHAGNALY